MSEAVPPNTTLAHYTILNKIGEGGMGEVYLAQDSKLDRKVALKLLPEAVASNQERMGSWLPASTGAPQVGLKAPDFTLTDSNDQPVTLAQLLTEQVNNKPPAAVLLIFYRGYW